MPGDSITADAPPDANWTVTHASRLITSIAAAAEVRPGDSIMCGLPEPTQFLYDLAARDDLHDVALFMPTPRKGGVAVARHPGIEVRAPFVSQILRRAGAQSEVVPLRLQDGGGYGRRTAARIRVVQVGIPRLDGTVPAGSVLAGNGGLVHYDRRPDDLVFALVNPVVPMVPGDGFHVDDFDGLIEVPLDGAVPVFDERTPPAELDAFVGALDDLIPDGSTVQSGVGGLTEVAMSAMTHKRDLGIHTEIMCQGLADLMRSGAANGSRKPQYEGRAVFTISLPETFSYIDRNPMCRMTHGNEALDPSVIAANPSMRCVNGAVEVDLLGQVNAEMIGGHQWSGVGGQLDFLRGCQMSDDALAIHLMPATAAGGAASRIVPRIGENAVTATRYDTQAVVTEFGVAWLKDATVRQRAERLIAVAHPDHRAELTDAAQQAKLVP